MKRTLLLILFASVLMVATTGLADDGLYDPAPPPNAAFVRIVHARQVAGTISPDLAGKPLEALSFQQASAYVVVPEGQREAALGAGDATSFDAVAGGFYTLAALDGGSTVITDPINRNLAKTLVSIYNLCGAEQVSLRTADGATTVVDGVAAGQVGYRAVNPISVDLAAFMGDQSVQAFPGLQLERGAAYSVFVMGAAAAPVAVWVRNTTSTR